MPRVSGGRIDPPHWVVVLGSYLGTFVGSQRTPVADSSAYRRNLAFVRTQALFPGRWGPGHRGCFVGRWKLQFWGQFRGPKVLFLGPYFEQLAPQEPLREVTNYLFFSRRVELRAVAPEGRMCCLCAIVFESLCHVTRAGGMMK